jgi:hypothetical protein
MSEQNITTCRGTCTLTLGAATVTSLPVTGGTGSFTVTAFEGYAYTATSGVPSQMVTVSQAPDSGLDTVGIFRPSNGFFYLRFTNSFGNANRDFLYGTANDIPLSGTGTAMV